MTNTKRKFSNINTVMKVLSTKPNKKKNLINVWCQWISNKNSYNIWQVLLLHAGKMIKLKKTKYIWEAHDVIILLLLVRVNNCQPILNISSRMVHIYSIFNHMNQFSIGYMINFSNHFNNVFWEQVEKCLNATFHEKKMETIRNVLKTRNTCVIALTMFYDNKEVKPKYFIGC